MLPYITSLYNDNYNPLFKQLVNEQDVKLLLIASLLHDLGHYPFAHEFEENIKDLHHEKITVDFLTNPTKDKDGFTIKDIIENADRGWGISLDTVKELLVRNRTMYSFQKAT